MNKLEQLYEGKAKKVFATEDPNLVIVDYKDDATAGDGAKKGTIRGKGVVNNKLSNNLMKMLAEQLSLIHILLLALFLKTQLGLSIRATGDNRDMVSASSIDPSFTITVGLCLANGLTALAGGVLAQYQMSSNLLSLIHI